MLGLWRLHGADTGAAVKVRISCSRRATAEGTHVSSHHTGLTHWVAGEGMEKSRLRALEGISSLAGVVP